MIEDGAGARRLGLALLAGLAFAACGNPSLPARRVPDLAVHRQELRPTNGAAMWHFDSAETVETYPSLGGGFRVHFTRAGRNAAVSGDANGNGTPDFVEQVAEVYDAVAAFYAGTLGYRAPLSDAALPDNGGDGRFDIYLVDFALASDGAFQVDSCPGASAQQCIGYVVQENDFAGYGYPSAVVATRILGSHEYFHAVQSAYDNGQGVVAEEGTAVLGTELFDSTLSDFEGFVGGYLEKPDRSLDVPPPGPVPSFAYGSALFFDFLAEKYDKAVVRKLWEHCENGQGLAGPGVSTADPYWLPQLDRVLAADYQSSFGDAFLQFAIWNLYTASAADWTRAYANGDAYPAPAMTEVTPPYSDPKLRAFYASTQYYRLVPAGRSAMTAALVDVADAGELDGLSLVLAVRRGLRWTEADALPDPASGGVAADTTGAADVVVAVVNRNLSGASKRPALCIGTPAEVASCRAELTASDGGLDAGPGEADAGAVDAGSPGSGGPAPEGCACATVPPGAFCLLAVLGAARPRRRCPVR